MRFSSYSELKLLERHAFIVTNSSDTIMMVEVDKLAKVLESFKEVNLEATVAFLEGMPPIEGTTSNHGGGSLFPDTIPPCNIPSEELEGAYAINTIAPELCQQGTKWAKQVAALEKWKLRPPLNIHDKVKPIGDTSIQLMVRSLEEYVGFCYKHLNMQPSMDLVMECTTFSQFMAFKEARDNESSTMLRAAQQVSMAVPFVMSGHCPLVKAYGPAYAAQCKEWYNNVKAVYRGRAAATPSKKSLISLATQWEMVDAEWEEFEEKLKVRHVGQFD